MMVMNRLQYQLKWAAIKAPGFGDRRKAMMEDIAILAGTTMISEELGHDLKDIGIADLGTAKKVTISKDHTSIIDGAGDAERIKERCKQIDGQIAHSTSDYDKEKLQERIAKLEGGSGVIYVGAHSEPEMKEIKARVEDALNSVRAALPRTVQQDATEDEKKKARGGIIPGGGVALLRCVSTLDTLLQEDLEEDIKTGVRIVRDAIQEPIRAIAHNAGVDASVVLNNVRSNENPHFGYNASSDTYGNMLEMGVIDPTKVVVTALEKAASVACTLLTSSAAITALPEKAMSMGDDMGGMGGMGGMPGMM